MPSLFTKILNGEIPGKIVHKDEFCAAILDINPQAPHHMLVFPIKEIRSVGEATKEDRETLGQLLLVAADLARKHGFSESGYRLAINTGKNGGQTVDHLHVHVLGGRAMDWPPG